MRSKIKRKPREWEWRKIEKYIWFPTRLSMGWWSQEYQTRWLERTVVNQLFSDGVWWSKFWDA